MKDFEILFKEGRFVGGDLVNMKIWRFNPVKYPRRKYTEDMLLIGFLVGKKVHKGAVKRNRIKRQMREVVRLLLKDEKIAHGYMIAVMAKPEAFGKEYVEIERSVVDVLKKARILVPSP